MNVVRVISL